MASQATKVVLRARRVNSQGITYGEAVPQDELPDLVNEAIAEELAEGRDRGMVEVGGQAWLYYLEEPAEPLSAAEARRAGWVRVGDWGWDDGIEGAWWARPGDAAAVRGAYEQLPDEGGYGPEDREAVEAAGGVWLAD